MNKANIFMLFILLAALPCFSDNDNLNKDCLSEFAPNKDALILGDWTIMKYVFDKSSVSCYSCSKIQFLKDGTGKITTPTNKTYKFKYTIIKDRLLFKTKTPKQLSELLCKNNDSEFHYEIKKEREFLHLILSSKTRDCEIVLTKGK